MQEETAPRPRAAFKYPLNFILIMRSRGRPVLLQVLA